MNKEEVLKAIMDLPKTQSNNPISAMNSISVDDLMSAIDRFDKVPTYDKLQKENKQLKESLKDEEQQRIKIAKERDGLHKECLNHIEQNKQLKEVIDEAINIAYEYAQIDGAHHKTWVIDQMIRELLGTEYDNFIKDYEEDGKYEWDAGIAP